MTARRVAMALREAVQNMGFAERAPDGAAPAATDQAASDRGIAEQAAAARVSWGELGCPKDTGVFLAGTAEVRVKRIHLIAAEDDPDALFTVVVYRPPLGPAEFMLGHRVA
jgi:hypothetical protein